MAKKITYDFDHVVSRAGSHAEKYDGRQRFFGHPDVVPLWVADMDLPSPSFLAKALRERIGHPLFGYTEQYNAVRDAIRWWMADQHGVEVGHEWISLSPSVVASMAVAVQSLTKPGESVAVLSPVYGPFFSCARSNGRDVADCPLQVKDGRFEIDFQALEAILGKPGTTLLLLSNPHNPGGRVWTRTELEKLAECCRTNGVSIFSDEIHCDIVYPPQRHTSMLLIEAAREIAIVAHSIGKTFNTSGLQASFCIVPGAELRSRFRAGQERNHTGDVNLLGKVALATALSPAGVDYKRQLLAYLRENTLEVCKRIDALGAANAMVPEATFLVWCDFRAYGPWQEVFKRLVHEAGVALSGGRFFGPAGEGWFRINCAHPRSQLYPAVNRILAEFGE
jgi:cystathionine beta-lyase